MVVSHKEGPAKTKNVPKKHELEFRTGFTTNMPIVSGKMGEARQSSNVDDAGDKCVYINHCAPQRGVSRTKLPA